MPAMTFRPRLRTVLLTLNLLVLLLPLGSIAILRLYESELVKQTESELISQAALTAAMFRGTYLQQFNALRLKDQRASISLRGNPLPLPTSTDPAEFIPIPPKLDLATGRIRPPALAAEVSTVPPDPLSLAAGQKLNPVLADARRVVMSGVRIVDHQGVVVASSGSEEGLSLATREEVAKALSGEPASLVRVRNSDSESPGLASISRRARLRVFVALPVIVENRVIGAVIASRTPLDVTKALYLMRNHLFKSVLVVLLVVMLMATLTAYYINRPVRALIRQADRLKSGAGGSEPLANPGIQEVAQLSAAIAEMAATLEDRSAYIRTFATSVSHEFKTPLTSIHGAVEILRDHFAGMSPAEREKFLAIIDGETGRLDRLVRRLLDLARADNFIPGEESCDGVAVLESLADRCRSQGMMVVLACPETPVLLGMGREAFESVAANLLENARQHGGEKVRIDLEARVMTEGDDRLLELDVRDDGPGISAGNRDKVFRPFFTTARANGGSGLGLAIVQALLRAHGGTISLEPAEKGARFRVRVPLC